MYINEVKKNKNLVKHSMTRLTKMYSLLLTSSILAFSQDECHLSLWLVLYQSDCYVSLIPSKPRMLKCQVRYMISMAEEEMLSDNAMEKEIQLENSPFFESCSIIVLRALFRAGKHKVNHKLLFRSFYFSGFFYSYLSSCPLHPTAVKKGDKKSISAAPELQETV